MIDMPKPQRKSSPQTSIETLARVLTKCRKAELVAFLTILAEEDSRVMRWLQSELDVAEPSEATIIAARAAIADATDFDDRDINRNFDYDYEAYDAIARYFTKLIDAGCISSAMSLSLELMEQGSHQVEMSDEGMMTDDIEDCIKVVIKALKKKNTCPPEDIIDWCAAMSMKDRIGFICDEEIQNLRESIGG
jgi:hypothetical protein